GENYSDDVVADTTLDGVAAITYTSGTTKPGYPKGCIHSNRNYMAISRFKESDVSGMPQMKNITALALLPSYTQTVLTTAYCDPIYLGCTVALEPFYSEQFFAYSVKINQPNFVVNTPGFFIQLAKKLENEPEWKSIDMPYLLLPIIVGEPISAGEERYLNRVAKKHKFGKTLLPALLSAPVSTGGGSTENGGIFTTLFCAWQGLKPKYRLHGERPYLQTLPLAEVEVLDENGNSCAYGEQGRLVINSPCNQIGYVNDEFNKDMQITDANGKLWYSGGAYAVKYKSGDIRIVGRPNTNIVTSDGKSTPLYVIEDIVNKDYKNIMSAVMVKIPDGDSTKYVCHIEKQPDAKFSDDILLRRCVKRLSKSIHPEILDNLYFKIRDDFPLAPSGKRDMAKLVAEGVDGTV
ncbi:MAG: class I adenylate-forming enzyme family protein, partial [Lachnospiraceae bacterium]|nr:class I adenylate-forming enzyme family protein [Lachnospiraceae bacterium]